ncbi:MAG: TolC family protein, partial [Desulfitobacterium sp.]|nr:TolC family protein [Desulfitobacterium sp.]
EQYRYGLAKVPTDFEFYKKQQEHEIEQLETDLELAKINVQQNVAEIYTGLESSMKVMEAMKYLAQQAEENYEIAQVKYENSLITLVELNNAKIAKVEADINLKNAELDAWLMQTTMNLTCDLGFQPSMPGN